MTCFLFLSRKGQDILFLVSCKARYVDHQFFLCIRSILIWNLACHNYSNVIYVNMSAYPFKVSHFCQKLNQIWICRKAFFFSFENPKRKIYRKYACGSRVSCRWTYMMRLVSYSLFAMWKCLKTQCWRIWMESFLY